jgi:tetratricopeptide (TPR) repeat protein
MANELIQISVRNPLIKILTLLLLIVAGIWSYFAISWYLGNTFAEYFDPAESRFDVAHRAMSMAPSDPLTRWRMAEVSLKNLPLDRQSEAIAEYEKAVSLSPNDYRYWMSLGTAYERAGESAKAEEALKRAVALAPSYAYPHWFLGNLFLRNARYDEAFAELRLASAADVGFQPQQFNLIWAIYGDDPEALKNAVGPTAAARASFALYLLSQKQFGPGLHLWASLKNEEKKANKETAMEIITSLASNYRFHDALNVWNDIANEKYRTEIERVFDGSFEEDVEYGPEVLFGWQIRNPPQMQIGIDPNRNHGGARSLKLLYQVRSNLAEVNVFQLVPVQPRTEYEVECYVATDQLQTGRAPHVDILDPTTNGVLVASAPAPRGTSNWNRVSLSFKTGETTEAVTIRIVRLSCADENTPVCPIFGSVWYDNFSIKRRN